MITQTQSRPPTLSGENYVTWVLVGIALGYRLVQDNNSLYRFVSPEGEEKTHLCVYGPTVRYLMKMHLVVLTTVIAHGKTEDRITLTVAGFERAHDRMKEVGFRFGIKK